jgi:RNA polymerase-interacting CarD/CdnL/TRCF family regulator
MTDAERLSDLIRRTERRLVLLELQDAVSGALAIALVLFAAVALGARVGIARGAVEWIVPTSLVVIAASLALWAARRRPATELAAARIDAEYGLDDRVRSALACLGSARAAAGMEAVLVADAISAASSVDPARVVRYARPAWLAPLLVAVAAACAVLVVPEQWLPGVGPAAANAEEIREAGRTLEARSLEVTERPKVAGDLRRIATDQAALGAEFQREPTSEREALARLSSLDERIDRVALPLGDRAEAAERARRRLEGALERAAGKAESGDSNDSRVQQAGGERAEERSLAERARAAAEAAQSRSLDASEKQALRDAARQLGGELEGLENTEELEAALEALAEGDMSADELEQLARALEDLEAASAEHEAAEHLRAANRAAKQQVAGRGPGERESNDKAGPFAGRGSTNDRTDQEYETESQPSTMESTRDRPDTRGEYEARNESERLGAQGASARVRGNLQRGAKQTTLFVQAAPGRAPTMAPYQEAYPRYRRSAERSIERSNVPPERRGVVRDYFDAINPDRGN